jgi:hypothetical protein
MGFDCQLSALPSSKPVISHPKGDHRSIDRFLTSFTKYKKQKSPLNSGL